MRAIKRLLRVHLLTLVIGSLSAGAILSLNLKPKAVLCCLETNNGHPEESYCIVCRMGPGWPVELWSLTRNTYNAGDVAWFRKCLGAEEFALTPSPAKLVCSSYEPPHALLCDVSLALLITFGAMFLSEITLRLHLKNSVCELV